MAHNLVHIIYRGDKQAQPDFVKMAQADYVFVIEPNGAAKCIKSRDGVYLDGNGNVTYEYISSQNNHRGSWSDPTGD